MPIHDWTRALGGTFHDFHLEWISAIKRTLNNGVLPSGYYAMAEQHAIGLIPDVLTLERRSEATPQNGNSANGDSVQGRGSGRVALAEAKPRVSVSDESETYARRRRTLSVRDSENDRLIAVIEIVSPGNKSARHALESFVNKACELLDAGIHLLVVDLFPPSRHDPDGMHGAIWLDLTDREFHLPSGKSRTVSAYAASSVMRTFVEPLAVGDSLPTMPLFLNSDEYVLLPLEPAYVAAFEAVPRQRRNEVEPPQ